MSDNKSIAVAKLIYNGATCFLEMPEFDIAKGYLIVIETDNGPEIASVSGITYTVPEDIQIGKIVRVCDENDLEKMKENEKREEEAFKITLEKIKKHDLEMKLVNVHYFLDDNKIIFNFTADERVDLRELV
jgi:cell fate regulator YaaT (PSP1 superfamily)